MKRMIVAARKTDYLTPEEKSTLNSFKSGYDFLDSMLFEDRYEYMIDDICAKYNIELDPTSTMMYFVHSDDSSDANGCMYDDYANTVLDIAKTTNTQKQFEQEFIRTFKVFFR